MLQIAGLIDPACAAMDLIDVFGAMAGAGSRIACAPLIYGYVSDAVPGFRPRHLAFGDLPVLGSAGLVGSALGGTGIAVSAFSKARGRPSTCLSAGRCRPTAWPPCALRRATRPCGGLARPSRQCQLPHRHPRHARGGPAAPPPRRLDGVPGDGLRAADRCPVPARRGTDRHRRYQPPVSEQFPGRSA